MRNNKNTTQTSLEELYNTDDLTLIKKAIGELTAKKDYKTLNTLFRRNPHASEFDTRSLNEDIPQKNKRFTKRNGKLCVASKSTPRTQQNDDEDAEEYAYTYRARYYDPNTKSFGYINKFHNPSGSRIRSRYYNT